MGKRYEVIVEESGTQKKYLVELKRGMETQNPDNDCGEQGVAEFKVSTATKSIEKPEKNEKSERREKPTVNPDPNLCYQIALAEYEHCIKRSERLDNKIYILLTVCAFIFVLLTGAIQKVSELRWPQSSIEWILLVLYFALTTAAIISVILLLFQLIGSLSTIKLKRFDSVEVMEKDMTHADSRQVSKYVIALYEEARNHNNVLIDKRYKTVNCCVKALIASVIILVLTSVIGAIMPAGEERFFDHVFYVESGDNTSDSNETVGGEAEELIELSLPNDNEQNFNCGGIKNE